LTCWTDRLRRGGADEIGGRRRRSSSRRRCSPCQDRPSK
jgi:hypothetical protein